MINSGVIVGLLKDRHREDIFVPECKTGATWIAKQMRKMDVWVMKRSWSTPLVVAYEVKVSRSDFLGDDKWQDYLNYCNEFYFVCPNGLIFAEELPPEVGLMYVSKSGNRLFTKKKAQRRSIEVPIDLYKYILMSRCQIVDSSFNRRLTQESQKKHWESWLAMKDENKNLGHIVSKKIRELIQQRIETVRADNYKLSKENNRLDDVKKLLEELNIDINGWDIQGTLLDRLGIPRTIKIDINRGIAALQKIQEQL